MIVVFLFCVWLKEITRNVLDDGSAVGAAGGGRPFLDVDVVTAVWTRKCVLGHDGPMLMLEYPVEISLERDCGSLFLFLFKSSEFSPPFSPNITTYHKNPAIPPDSISSNRVLTRHARVHEWRCSFLAPCVQLRCIKNVLRRHGSAEHHQKLVGSAFHGCWGWRWWFVRVGSFCGVFGRTQRRRLRRRPQR